MVKISNNIEISCPNEDVLSWCEQNLIVTNPLYTQLKIIGKEDLIRKRHIPEKLNLFSKRRGTLILPFGVLQGVWDYIKNDKYELSFNDNGDISIKNDSPTYEMFDYQEEAVNAMINAKSGILVAPCAAGKTFMGIELIRRIGKKALWLCHTGDLLRQARDDMKEQYPNVKIGLTTEGKLEIGDDVTISTVQTMSKIDPSLYEKEFDVVICDEAAHVSGSPTQMKMFISIISKIAARYKYGLTATPFRSDGMEKSMFAYIGLNTEKKFKSVYTITKDKVISIPSVHEKVEMYNGFEEDYSFYDTSGMIIFNKLINTLSECSKRTDKIIDNIIKCNEEQRKQVVLCGRVSHCEEIVKKLVQNKVKAVLCVGKTNDKIREQIMKQQIEWDVIVATYSLLKEGVSIKELDTLHLATPIKARDMIIQCAGRIERYIENKKTPIVYDYVDMDIPKCQYMFTERKRALKNRK
nr:MAG TPA: DNA helicase [Caudoviricetes sp.]